ncbi:MULTISPECIES: DNA primase [Bacillaceae]|uniref:DNA primase n=1 Tax=Bacillaceae TaxID=186817 RepID=UPI000AB09612|nr:toprim domain-containing protein [Bacillus rubiinfantis]
MTKMTDWKPSGTAKELRKRYVALYNYVASFYHHLLCNTVEGEQAHQYLLDRGFTRETIDTFQIGWSYQSDVLRKLLLAHAYDLDECEIFGLLKPDRRRNGMRTGLFHNRITIPIRNLQGDIIAFSGRVLPGDTYPAKYMNTPDTPFFVKGKHLYNLNKSVASIKGKEFAILFEGYFDTMAAMQHGLENVVSVMGTSLTEDQIESLQEWTDRVVVCYDGDSAGMESAKRIGETLIKKGMDLRFAVLPRGVDPHDYITKHKIEKFRKEIVAKAVSFSAFSKEQAKRSTDFSSEPDKMRYANKTLGDMTKTASAKESEMLLRELGAELGISTEIVRELFNRNYK